MHVTKLVQVAALLAVGAQASSAPDSQDSTLEARAPAGYSRPADLVKFNWHIPKLPTWKELQEPADRYKGLAASQAKQVAAKQAAKSEGKKASRRSLENDEEPEQKEHAEVKRGVAWSA
ncbi:hypothetical protein RB595_003520 [Gaeumannomyces hyphopodioides]